MISSEALLKDSYRSCVMYGGVSLIPQRKNVPKRGKNVILGGETKMAQCIGCLLYEMFNIKMRLPYSLTNFLNHKAMFCKKNIIFNIHKIN